jgi:hypothetical protein
MKKYYITYELGSKESKYEADIIWGHGTSTKASMDDATSSVKSYTKPWGRGHTLGELESPEKAIMDRLYTIECTKDLYDSLFDGWNCQNWYVNKNGMADYLVLLIDFSSLSYNDEDEKVKVDVRGELTKAIECLQLMLANLKD